MGRLAVFLMSGLMLSPAFADESFTGVQVDEGKVVKQQLYEGSDKACGPAAMLNVLRFGTPEMQRAFAALVGGNDRPRLRFVVDRYFNNRQSLVFPRAKRLGFKGVFGLDLKNAFNELLEENKLEALVWMELDRREEEGDRDFLQRVHGELENSLSNGVPPIIQLRSYAAMRESEGNSRVVWRVAGNHFLVLTRLPSVLRKQDEGFVIDAIDPNGGRLVSAYVFGERQLPFRAEKSATGPGEVKWLSGRPFLLVKAPGVVSLQPHKATWEDRVIVTLSGVIGQF